MTKTKNIAIAGAGLVGSLLSIYLAKRGYSVTVFERRGDMRQSGYEGGRSINLALSNRGIRALDEVDVADEIKKVTIPMHGRIMHNRQGELTFQPYGSEGQFINSVSRRDLNIVLMNKAESLGVEFKFDQRITKVDLDKTTITADHQKSSTESKYDYIIGADGAFSVIRGAFQITDRFDYSQDYIDHGYKELHIPAGKAGSFQLEKNALHIWPRESFMMIALPNPDGSFTCTLFFPFEGTPSFSHLKTDAEVSMFFESTFPDAVSLMPTLLEDYNTNPTSSLVTVRCYPWVKNNTLLIGDAAHALVPFFGQGMNAGFEDCRVLNQLLDIHSDDWTKVLSEFQRSRKNNADAIAQLALDNFIEMRDLVADADFLLRKKIEARLHQLYPTRWIPLYSMVTFYDSMPYATALETGRKQKKIMDEVMKTSNLKQKWESLNFKEIVNKIN
ncbi:MAG: FAD-dependent monooxygenase [Cyclobacteriaceae bacterium]|nr:FAD-dependent monooxygenase [Cyclobacteriaceae bacterium]